MNQNNKSPYRKNEDSHVYKYPEWIQSVSRFKQIGQLDKPVWVSIMKTRNRTLLDVRRFYKGKPTLIGIFITRESALDLIEILDDFLSSGDLPATVPDEYVPEWEV